MKKFKNFNDLDFNFDMSVMGTHATMDFENGYSVSVIRGQLSYGGPDGLYELAIIKDKNLCYDTPITDDVCGYLTEKDVSKIMKQIQLLPKA